MSDIVRVTESTDQMFTDVLKQRGITQYINVAVFHDPKLKVKDHVWCNIKIIDDKTKAVMTDIAHDDVPDIVIFIREDFLNTLYNISPDMASLAVVKAIEGISVNVETGKVSVNKPDVLEHMGILEKYGVETAITVYNAAVEQTLQRMQNDANDNTIEQ